MVLFILIALAMVVATLAVLIRPMLGGAVVATAGGNDAAIYRDQLAEIDRDAAAGLIAPLEAGAARTEVARRLLATATPGAAPLKAVPGRRLMPVVTLAVAVPLIAVGIYLAGGAPYLANVPPRAAQQASIERMIVQVERHLDRNPEDGRGWDVIAPVYMRRGQYQEAAQALRRSIDLLGETAARRSLLGEAIAGAANGLVTAEAREAFDRAVALDAKEPRARYFLGLAAEQDGRMEDAAQRYRALLADAPPNAPYADAVREAIARVVPGAQGAPDADAVAAASRMNEADRAQFIRTMVDRLAARLQEDGSDVEGWLRLIRAFRVIGDEAATTKAISDARHALGGDAARSKTLESGLVALGIGG